MPVFRSARALLTCALLLSSATVFASSPRLTIIMPRGGQRGQEVAFTFSGSQLGDAEEIFFYEPGFEVKSIEAVGSGSGSTAQTVSIAACGEIEMVKSKDS